MPKTETWAIFTGRFQPFHLGHLDFVKLIREKISPRVIIAVCFKIEEERFFRRHIEREHPFFALAEERHKKEKNPFTFWEVYEMISRSIQSLSNRSEIIILPYPRGQIWWPIPRYWLPPNRTWVFCDTDEHYEREKIDFYQSFFVDEQIVTLKPRFVLHNSEIRNQILTQNDLKKFFPQGAIEVLKKINGFNRLGIKTPL